MAATDGRTSQKKKLANIEAAKEPVPDFNEDGTVQSSDQAKAELVGNFFRTQYTNRDTDPDLLGAPFDFEPITEQTPLHYMSRQPVYKSNADPLLNNRILREYAPVIAL